MSKKMNSIQNYSLHVFILLAVLGLTSAAAAAADLPMGVSDTEIKIGYHAGMTGGAAFMGYDALKGLQTVASSVNDSGGIHGRRIKIVWADDGYNPAKAIAADKRFAQVDKVFAVVGNVGTTNGVASSKTLNKLGIPFIAPAAYSVHMHKPVNKYTFMLAPYWGISNEILANYLVEQGVKKVGIIYQDDEAGRESADALDATLKKLLDSGLVAKAPFERGATDFSSQVLACKSGMAEVVVTIAPQGAVASVLREGSKLGYKFQLYGSTAAADPKVIELAGKDLAEGMRAFVFNPSPDEKTEGMLKLKKEAAQYHPGDTPGFAFFNAYGGMIVLVDALKRVGKNFTMKDFLAALNSTTDLSTSGLFNPITFSPNDHSGHNYLKIVEFKQGEFRSVTDWIGVPKK